MMVSLVPSAEYGAPVTRRTLLEPLLGAAAVGVAGQVGTSSARTVAGAAPPSIQASASASARASWRLQCDAIGRSLVSEVGSGFGRHDAIDANGAVVRDHHVDPVTLAGAVRPGIHRHQRALRGIFRRNLQC